MSRLLGLVFLLAATAPALAQTSNSGAGIGSSQQVAQPRAETPALKNVAPSAEHLLGDLGGLRTRLEDHGIYLLLDGITEFAGNVSGGTRRGPPSPTRSRSRLTSTGSVWPASPACPPM